jgi:hypothetical protein
MWPSPAHRAANGLKWGYGPSASAARMPSGSRRWRKRSVPANSEAKSRQRPGDGGSVHADRHQVQGRRSGGEVSGSDDQEESSHLRSTGGSPLGTQLREDEVESEKDLLGHAPRLPCVAQAQLEGGAQAGGRDLTNNGAGNALPPLRAVSLADERSDKHGRAVHRPATGDRADQTGYIVLGIVTAFRRNAPDDARNDRGCDAARSCLEDRPARSGSRAEERRARARLRDQRDDRRDHRPAPTSTRTAWARFSLAFQTTCMSSSTKPAGEPTTYPTLRPESP